MVRRHGRRSPVRDRAYVNDVHLATIWDVSCQFGMHKKLSPNFERMSDNELKIHLSISIVIYYQYDI